MPIPHGSSVSKSGDERSNRSSTTAPVPSAQHSARGIELEMGEEVLEEIDELLSSESADPWAAADRLLPLLRTALGDSKHGEPASGQTGSRMSELIGEVERLGEMHRSCIGTQRVMETTLLGLEFQRDVYLRKLREVEGVGERNDWGVGSGSTGNAPRRRSSGLSAEESSFLSSLHSVLYEENEDFALDGPGLA